ncbi:MAG: general secretion pathway protein GspK, partial [Desulfobacterales bacterium]|nr:general secretion pathway protein GspK [Desulfobacterales bacterium]
MRRLKDNSGVALILTIMIISLIVGLTLQFNSAMRSELHAAVNLRDGVWLGCVARSGFDYAQAVLFEDALQEKPYDSLHEAWANAGLLSQGAASMLEEGGIEVRIDDHSGRIQINRLVDQKGEYDPVQKGILTRLLSLEHFGLEAEEVGNIIDAIKDWIDADNEVTVFGAESAYYKALERPYPCRNGPLESLEELLFVRGITRGLFYGTKRGPGISRYLSVYGDGRININTADPLVLMTL